MKKTRTKTVMKSRKNREAEKRNSRGREEVKLDANLTNIIIIYYLERCKTLTNMNTNERSCFWVRWKEGSPMWESRWRRELSQKLVFLLPVSCSPEDQNARGGIWRMIFMCVWVRVCDGWDLPRELVSRVLELTARASGLLALAISTRRGGRWARFELFLEPQECV